MSYLTRIRVIRTNKVYLANLQLKGSGFPLIKKTEDAGRTQKGDKKR